MKRDSSWRPENWKPPADWMTAKYLDSNDKISRIYEMGADAMLEALRRHCGISCEKPYDTLLVEAITPKMIELNCKSGQVVIIPFEYFDEDE